VAATGCAPAGVGAATGGVATTAGAAGCATGAGAGGVSAARLLTYSVPAAANSPALQISARMWGLKGNVMWFSWHKNLACYREYCRKWQRCREYRETYFLFLTFVGILLSSYISIRIILSKINLSARSYELSRFSLFFNVAFL
jgi:hypothetical protein